MSMLAQQLGRTERTDMHLYPPQFIVRKPMSEAEYLALGETKPKVEWVDGVALIMMAPAIMSHGAAIINLGHIFKRDLQGIAAIADGGIKLPRSYRVPDLIVMPLDMVEDTEFSQHPPLIAVEVLSPSTKKEDQIFKSVEYANIGVGQYWIVDTKKQRIEIMFNTGSNWDPASKVIVDQKHPTVDIPVTEYGIVHLDIAELW